MTDGAASLADGADPVRAIRLDDVGARLKAFRIGRRLTPEALASQIGISRAALYRTEKGQIAKIETLVRIADVLEVSLPTLLGVGVEYIDNATTFFERMRQLEERSTRIVGLFGPVSYLLTSDAYDGMLEEVLREVSIDGAVQGSEQGSEQGSGRLEEPRALMAVLRQRKAAFRRRRPRIVSLIATADIERFLVFGALGRFDLDAAIVAERRRLARHEAEHIAGLLGDPPDGVEIGVLRDAIPATTFQIFAQPDRSLLAISPFRLGEQPNVSVGVGMITGAPEAMDLHERIAGRLWARALKGAAGADHVRGLIARHGVVDR